MPRFDTVNVPSARSAGVSLRSRAASTRRRDSVAMASSDCWSASLIVGTSNASGVSTAIPTFTRPCLIERPGSYEAFSAG